MARISQGKMILDYLREGKTLTSLEALHKFGCLNLKGRIWELRQQVAKEGYRIDTSWIITNTGKRIAEYKLVKKGQTTFLINPSERDKRGDIDLYMEDWEKDESARLHDEEIERFPF